MSDFVLRPVSGQPIATLVGPVRRLEPVAPVRQAGDGSGSSGTSGDRPSHAGGRAQKADAGGARSGEPEPSAVRAATAGRTRGSPAEPAAGATLSPERGSTAPDAEATRAALTANRVGPPPAFPINVLEAEARRDTARHDDRQSEAADRRPGPQEGGHPLPASAPEPAPEALAAPDRAPNRTPLSPAAPIDDTPPDLAGADAPEPHRPARYAPATGLAEPAAPFRPAPFRAAPGRAPAAGPPRVDLHL